MLTSLHEPHLLQGYYTDFLKQINQYQNIARTGVFVTYYNINVLQSIYEQTLESTLDIYGISEVKFDIYELTPVFFIGPVANTIGNITDLDGLRVDGSSTVTLYTIKRPRVHDLIKFTSPIESGEIFRITGIRTTTNMLHSSPSVEWFEADLDYAPVKDTKSLKIENRYVYDLSTEINIPYNDYMDKLNWLNDMSRIFSVAKEYYNIKEDVYAVDNIIPVILNEIIILIKKEFDEGWLRLFDDYESPYGFKDFCVLEYDNLSAINFGTDNIGYRIFDLSTNQKSTYVLGHGLPKLDTAIELAKQLHSKAMSGPWIKNK
jgi:hypothetical protein